MRIPGASRLALVGLVALALAALAAVAGLSRPVTVAAAQPVPPQPPAVAAVSVAARACPLPAAPGSRGTGVATISAAARTGAGLATVSRLTATGGSPGTPLASLSQPGALVVSGVPAVPAGQPGGVMITATGAMAQGLAAEQTTGGVVTAGCASPGTDFWFAAPGQQLAGVIRLYLMNVDSQASAVDVDIVTDTGPLQTGADTGITVPPHGLVVQSLASLVRGSRAIGLQVRTSAGRVVAALNESSKASQPGQWVPAAQPPATRLVIPALPSSAGTRQLYVADPGGSDAAVRLSVVAAGGTYQPTGAGAIDIPAGSASQIQLPSLSAITGAAVLTSSVPVTAAVVVPGGMAGGPGAMTAAAPAIQQQGVVVDAGQRGDTTTLVLSAPGRAVRVRLVTGTAGLTSGASGSGQVVSVPAGRSVAVTVTSPAGGRNGRNGKNGRDGHQAFAIVLTPLPGSGPLYAGRVLAQSRTVLAIMPVASALTSVRLSRVRAALINAAP